MKLPVLAIDEVQRLFSTRRGLLSLLGFCLIWAAVLMYAVLPASRFFKGASESGLLELLSPGGLAVFQAWPVPEMAVYWLFSLYMLPFLSIVTAADQTASDRSRGTLRYLVLRCSRLQIFFGRYIGQVIIVLLVILATLASVLGIVAFRSIDQLPQALADSPVIIVNLILVLAPYIALMALVSILARSARQATIFALIIWLAVSFLVSYLKAYFPDLHLLEWVLPGSQISDLILLSNWQTLALAPVPIVHTFVLLCIGAVVMKRRDL